MRKTGLALLGMLSLVTASNALALDKVSVGLTPAITNAVVYVAKAEGIFERNGIDLEIISGGGSVLVSGVVSGSMQLAAPTLTTILQGVESGLPFKIVGGMNVPSGNPEEYMIVTRDGAAISQPSDFAGKTVGVSTIQAILHVMFMEYLKQHNVAPKDVRYVEIPFPQMTDVMRKGTVDAVVSVQPFASRIISSGVGKPGDNFVSALPEGLPLLAFIASDDYIAKNGDVIRRFMASLKEAEKIILADRQKALEQSNQFLKMPPDVLSLVSLPKYQLDFNASQVQVWGDILKGLDLLQSDVKLDGLVSQK